MDSEIVLHDPSIGNFASRGGGHAFERWALSDDLEEFRAHISSRYLAESSSLAPSTTAVSRDSGGSSVSWPACCGCWKGLLSLCRRAAPVDEGKQLYLFVTKDRFREMIGSAASRQESSDFFDRWHRSVPGDRRWGSVEDPSVSVAVDGVFLPR